jgi:hypothetical protein
MPDNSKTRRRGPDPPKNESGMAGSVLRSDERCRSVNSGNGTCIRVAAKTPSNCQPAGRKAKSTSHKSVPRERHVLQACWWQAPAAVLPPVPQSPSHCGNTLRNCLCISYIRAKPHGDRAIAQVQQPNHTSVYQGVSQQTAQTTNFKSSNLSNDRQRCHCPFSS